MELNHKSLAVLLAGVGVLVAGAYGLGKQQSTMTDTPPPSGVSQAAAAVPAAPTGPRTEGKAVENENARFTHFRVGNKNVKSMFIEGPVVWIGTSGGVIRYDTASDNFKLHDVSNGLLSNGAFYVGRLQGRFAVGTYGGGLSLLDEKSGKWANYNIPQGLGDAFVYDVLEAKNGDVWIATWSGVNRIRGGNLDDRSKWELHTVESTKGGLINDWVYGLAEGKDGIIWLATEGGLVRFENGKWQNWNHAKGQGAPYEKVKKYIAFKTDPSKESSHHARQKQEMGLSNVDVAYNPNYIVSLDVGPDGVVWAGTWGGGLARFDGKKWTNYTTVEGLPGNHVFMLHRDSKGELWVGTNSGLARMSADGKFKTMSTQDGLFAENVFSMVTGDDGSLWVGSYGGVAHIKRPD